MVGKMLDSLKIVLTLSVAQAMMGLLFIEFFAVKALSLVTFFSILIYVIRRRNKY